MMKNEKNKQGSVIMILLHILAWTILVGFPIYIINRWNISADYIWISYINIFINGFIFYINYFVLIPKFFFSANQYRYYVSALLLIACFYFVSDTSNKLVFNYASSQRTTELVDNNPRDYHNHSDSLYNRPAIARGDSFTNRPPARRPSVQPGLRRPPFRQMHFFNYALSAFVITFFSLGLRVLARNTLIEKRQKELEKEKLNSELAFLKNQISPHFFFNTLNNIYSLISINTEDSQKAVLQLSRMMRYLLYESEHREIELSNEIEFMNNYIDLMRLRMSDKVKLDITFPSEFENIMIPPLLFIPIIENAFKHGVSYREKSFIKIRMEISKESITFNCSNSIVKPVDERAAEHSGIGLENIKKRLNLLFPVKHEFKIDKTDSAFEVVVQIRLA
jgi:two-component system, LytTR family, sensor kinase